MKRLTKTEQYDNATISFSSLFVDLRNRHFELFSIPAKNILCAEQTKSVYSFLEDLFRNKPSFKNSHDNNTVS